MNDTPENDSPELVEVRLAKPLTFTNHDGSITSYTAGRHMMPPEVAGHWFTLAHTEDPPKTEPPAGSHEQAAAYMQHANAMREKAQAEQVRLDAELAQKQREEAARAQAAGAGFLKTAATQALNAEERKAAAAVKAAGKGAKTGRVRVAPTTE